MRHGVKSHFPANPELPAERRAEILSEAAKIALTEGLERITVRAVADRLGVRPGLISHYYPATEDLVIAAFVRAVSEEREELFPVDGDPLTRMAHLLSRIEGNGALERSRLWLNARHLCRFIPLLAQALQDQERLDRTRLTSLIEDGIASGDFAVDDPFAACIRILVAIDGVGAYVNNVGSFDYEAFTRFVSDVAEWSLGMEAGRLRAAVDFAPHELTRGGGGARQLPPWTRARVGKRGRRRGNLRERV